MIARPLAIVVDALKSKEVSSKAGWRLRNSET